jgi:hypothetical protein
MQLVTDPTNKLLRAGFDLVEDASVVLKPEAPKDEGDHGVLRLSLAHGPPLDCRWPPFREQCSRGGERGAQLRVCPIPHHLGEGTVQGEMVVRLIMGFA